ncbi:MAG: hypothetical protein IPP32_17500 [Bacteroidetes bacterium]|nr:hypothetical protein [Bacteroidota bacterium]
MNKIKLLLVVLIFSIGMENAFSQTLVKKVFPDDPTEFLKKIKDQMEDQDKKATHEFMELFEVAWNGQKFTSSQQGIMISTCNLMFAKRLKMFPDFKNYLSSAMNFVNSGQTDKSFTAWQLSIDKILGKSANKFSDFIEMSDNLFSTNTIFKNSTLEWKASGSNYTFEFDSVPKVVFGETDLRCIIKDDSSVIYSTQGTYYPSTQRWIGKGGTVNWRRAGVPAEQAYAELKRYSIVFKSSQYRADSVLYHNTIYFQKPLLGVLQDKVFVNMTEERAVYPQFDSYDKRLVIANIYQDVDYDGGFSVKGSKIIGTGDRDNPAFLKFFRNKKLFLKSASLQYIMKPERITSDKAEITFYFDGDSIYHPGLQLKFSYKDKEVVLIRDQQGTARTPYFDSFHKLDMYFEALYWRMDEPKIELKNIKGSAESSALFESSAFFRAARFERLQGMDDVNPLYRIRQFVMKQNAGGKEFDPVSLSRFMQLSPDQVKPMLMILANGGFLTYNVDLDKVVVKDRLFDYIRNSEKKRDYDVIQFNSTVGGSETNASLNLLNFDLRIDGVERIFLSDSQNVNIYPKNQTVLVRKNRDFDFAGVVNAGRFQFFGKEFNFDYTLFKINLTNVDSLRIKVLANEVNEYNERKLVYCKTVIESVNGDLLIDRPTNKSGTVDYPDYPIFNSKKESFAYYSRSGIQKGVYKRDSFYFKLTPYTIDSLDNFTNEALAFKGTLASGGIFPDFDETLRLQEDYSLGFKRETPAGGFPMYGNKGTYTSTIKLSNKGLRGDGTLEYVTSTTKSKDFIFFPDSMNAIAQSFENKEQAGAIEFPPVKGDSVYAHWMPYKDYMEDNGIRKPMDFYTGQAELFGKSTLTPTGMTGKGRMDFSKASLFSDKMVFNKITFDADTSDFQLNAEELSALAFSTKNVNAHVDFAKRQGVFKSNGEGSFVNFPVNQYICFMDKFTWFMDQKSIELSASTKSKTSVNNNTAEESDEGSLNLEGSEFISVHPDQDSLRFFSPRARYDLKSYLISCKEVKYINVADARIFPDSGNVVIQKKAKMETLNNAKILANLVTKYHNIYNVSVNILARKKYSGSGDYDYVSETKEKQKIHFTNISTDTTFQSFAIGDITEESKFTLSPYFDYRGKAKLYANQQFLTFDGSFLIKHECPHIGKSWLSFSGEINPSEIYIPIAKDMKDNNNDKLVAGIMYTADSTHCYPAFLSRRVTFSDQIVAGADGYLFYDKASREYKISNKDKIKEINFPGNYVSLNTANCKLYAEGKLEMTNGLGQVKFNVYGNGVDDLQNDSVAFDVVITLDFFFADDALKNMGNRFETSTAPFASLSRTTYERALREMLGKADADKLISQVNLYGSFKKFPDAMEHSIILTDVKMKWNSNTKSFVSDGPIGVGSVFKNQINKFMGGKIELAKKRAGDILTVYLEIDGANWYFFNYQTSLMQAISSDEKFNSIIRDMKADKRKMEVEKGQTQYSYNLSTAAKKTSFLKKIDTQEK